MMIAAAARRGCGTRLRRHLCSFTDPAQFSRVDFWNEFHKKKGSEFEWYASPQVVLQLLESMRHSDDILHIGCGTSTLGKELRLGGYNGTVNIDNADEAIDLMKTSLDPEGASSYLVEDVTALSFDAKSFDVVLEKGTMDALEFGDRRKVEQMASEVDRVLRPGGSWIQVTEEPPEYRRERLRELLGSGWMVSYRSITDDLLMGDPEQVVADCSKQEKESSGIKEEPQGVAAVPPLTLPSASIPLQTFEYFLYTAVKPIPSPKE